MNEFWLMGAIIAWIVFLIFMMLPATEERYIERTFDPEGDYIIKATIVWIWAIRILSLIIAVTFALLYFL
jgi:hypothetical protein